MVAHHFRTGQGKPGMLDPLEADVRQLTVTRSGQPYRSHRAPGGRNYRAAPRSSTLRKCFFQLGPSYPEATADDIRLAVLVDIEDGGGHELESALMTYRRRRHVGGQTSWSANKQNQQRQRVKLSVCAAS